MKTKLLLITALVLSLAVYIKYIDKVEQEQIQLSADHSLLATKTAYNSIFDTYSTAAYKDYIELMKNKKVLEILKEFKYTQKEKEKQYLRGLLFRTLHKKYDLLKKFKVRQFHFHTHKGESLLRFHLPYESGDSLMKLRKTIRYANTKQAPIFGFEGGRIYPGFRYVFPIVEHGDHLGSIEFSLSFEAIEEKLKTILLDYDFMLHLSKETTIDKVFTWHKSFFSDSPLKNNYYIENETISKSYSLIKRKRLVQALNEKVQSNENFQKVLKNNQNLSIPIVYNKQGYVVNFLQIINTENEFAGYVVSYGELEGIKVIQEKTKTFKLIGTTAIIIIFIIGWLLNLQRTKTIYKKKLLEESRNNLQSILDHQKNIVLLNENFNLTKVNSMFLEVSGYSSLEEFKKEHQCICELFIEKDLESLISQKEFLSAIESGALEKITNKQAILFNQVTQKEEYYLISANKYNKNKGFVIVLTNITKIIELEKEHLRQEKIIMAQSKVTAVGELISNIGHQWRQPLSIISSAVSGLKLAQELGEEITDESIDKINDLVTQQTKYLSKTIDDFNYFFETTRSELLAVNIKETMYKVESLIQDFYKNTYISYSINSIDKEIELDEKNFIQALVNICSNTKDAMERNNIPESQRYFFLDVTSHKNNEIVICLKDSAGGINEDLLDTIFEPYTTTKHKSQGTGLGLYMSYQIITKHLGGSIEVSNVEYQYNAQTLKGAEFLIKLPLKQRV